MTPRSRMHGLFDTLLGLGCWSPCVFGGALVFGIGALAFARTAWQEWRMTRENERARRGLCPRCGYDLRATGAGDVCPECGTPRPRVWVYPENERGERR